MAYQCPSCQSAYTPGSRFCATCGTSLQEPASDSLPSGYAHTASGLLACPRCQSSNQPDATYCYSCGFPQEGAIHIAEARFPGVPAYTQARPGRSRNKNSLRVTRITPLAALGIGLSQA